MPALTLDVRPDAMAVLTIDQPGKKANVFSTDLLAEFEDVIAGLKDRKDIRSLVIASAKPGIFVAGADLKVFANATPHDPAVRAFIDRGNRVLFALEELPFPTCAAIDGVALGGGLELAMACDFRVCGENPRVRLGLPETTLGLIPGWGGTQRLPRLVGPRKAAEMLSTGMPVDTAGAKATGLGIGPIDLASPERFEALLKIVHQPFEKLAQIRLRRPWSEVFREEQLPSIPVDATTAVSEALRVMLEGAARSLREGIALETDAFMAVAGTEESKRKIAEFFASRTA